MIRNRGLVSFFVVAATFGGAILGGACGGDQNGGATAPTNRTSATTSSTTTSTTTTSTTSTTTTTTAAPAASSSSPYSASLADGNIEIVFSQQIQFEVGKADIKAESNDFISFIAQTIQSHPELAEKKGMVEISGHTDTDGVAKDNVTLSQKRSEAVRTALIALGVSPKILRGKGYGPYCPVDPASTAAAKAKNRRVQFLILKWDCKKTTAVVGCDNAAKNGVKPLPLP